MLTPLPGATPQKPGWASRPFFGVEPVVLGPDGQELEGECEGYLAFKRSWPGQLRGVYGDQRRFEETYFQLFNAEGQKISNDKYIAGDACRRSADGYYCITGRIDDVINVSGHRIGTAELESALVLFDACTEAAVVGFPHPVKVRLPASRLSRGGGGGGGGGFIERSRDLELFEPVCAPTDVTRL